MLLSPQVCGRLEKMRFNPKTRMTSKNRGDHLSGRGGSSTEFSDYRNYSPGDDLRYVDWNIFSRLQKPYLKQFHLEEEMHVVIIIDASQSMNFGGKFELAQKLALAFSTIALFSNERASVYLINDSDKSLPAHFGPVNNRFSSGKIKNFIETAKCSGNAHIDQSLDQIAKHHKGKGIALILSDFLSGGNLQNSFNLLFSNGLAPYALQILAPEEISPEINGDARFVDSETKMTLDISSAGQLFEIYQEYLGQLQENLQSWIHQRNGLYHTISSDCSIEKLLFDILIRRRWIK
jgi:hypothetical protein